MSCELQICEHILLCLFSWNSSWTGIVDCKNGNKLSHMTMTVQRAVQPWRTITAKQYDTEHCSPVLEPCKPEIPTSTDGLQSNINALQQHFVGLSNVPLFCSLRLTDDSRIYRYWNSWNIITSIRFWLNTSYAAYILSWWRPSFAIPLPIRFRAHTMHQANHKLLPKRIIQFIPLNATSMKEAYFGRMNGTMICYIFCKHSWNNSLKWDKRNVDNPALQPLCA